MYLNFYLSEMNIMFVHRMASNLVEAKLEDQFAFGLWTFD